MKLYKKSNIDIATLSVLIEVIIFSVIYFIIGFLYNKQDPLLLSSEVNFFLLLLSTITLYYGLNIGLFLIMVFGIFSYFYYNIFPMSIFLQNLIFVLICGEFHFFYRRTIRKLKEENYYYVSKFEQLRNSFYLLKLSHDQLEKSFILKPVSLRSIMYEIRNMYFWDEDEASKKQINLLAKNYGITVGSIFIDNGGNFVKIAHIGEPFELNRFNVMFNKAMEERRATYISEELDELRNYEYIAVIPAINCEDRIVGYLIIKEMNFLNYNRETMLTISIIMSFYADFLTQKETLKKVSSISGIIIFDSDFNYELMRLYRLKEKFSIDSSYFLLKYDDNLSKQIDRKGFFEFIRENIRNVDMADQYGNLFVILLPLIGYSGAKSFQNRINNLISNKLRIDPSIVDQKILEFTDYNTDIDMIKVYAT